MNKVLSLIIVLCMVVALGTTAFAADVDLSKANVTIICPYGAGGGTDLCTRILGQAAEKVVGGPYTVENHTGGSGTTGL